MLFLVASAHAVDLSESAFGLSGGFEYVTNDPYLNRRGWRHGVSWQMNRWAEIGVAATWYPVLGTGGSKDPDWKPLAKTLLRENEATSDLSKLVFQAQFTVRVFALRAPLGAGWTGGLGLLAGAGAFATQDDPVALYGLGERDLTTQHQVHGGLVGGGFVDARAERLGVRLRYEMDAYVETTDAIDVTVKQNILFGAEVLCWF